MAETNGNGATVTASPAALEMIGRLRAQYGPLVFFQSGGCCDGTSPICLMDGELPPGGGDRLLGTVGDCAFYVDGEQYARWREPRFLLDVGAGAAEGFSLSMPDAHFVIRSPQTAP